MGVQYSQEQAIEGMITSLTKALDNLAPHPDDPVCDGGLQFSFGCAAEALGSNDIMEMMREYFLARAAGKTTDSSFVLGAGQAISAAFNAGAQRNGKMMAYTRDLPRRLGIERWLAEYRRRLCSARKYAALGLAA